MRIITSVWKEELKLKKCSIYEIDIFGIQSFKNMRILRLYLVFTILWNWLNLCIVTGHGTWIVTPYCSKGMTIQVPCPVCSEKVKTKNNDKYNFLKLKFSKAYKKANLFNGAFLKRKLFFKTDVVISW